MQTLKTRIILAAFVCTFGAALCSADMVTFRAIPDSGLTNLQPLETSGWGYSIQNTTSYYVVPVGLSNSGVLYGSLGDIFDYPVVDPGQTAFQTYSYNAPGGWGSSLGLFEYTLPANTPAGLDQSGLFSLTYQLYNADPDLDYTASPVGPYETLTFNFDVTAGSVASAPEPSTVLLFTGVGGLLLMFRRVQRHSSTKR